MTYMLPRPGSSMLDANDRICTPTQQQPNQTAGSPALRAEPGSAIALRYQENGHVTLPELSPEKVSPGWVFVYGTTAPSATDSVLQIHKVWSPDGTGGDGRGCLLGVFTFDDGRCFQVNNGSISRHRQLEFGHPPDPLQGADLWCENLVRLPDNLGEMENITLYWVWDWPSASGKPQLYTTCMDIKLVSHLC